MPSYFDYLQQVKAQIREISALQLQKQPPTVLIDVREPDEQQQGTIPGAMLVPRGLLESRIEALAPSRDTDIVLYCAGGSRSALAASALLAMGFSNVASLAGGMTAWASLVLFLDLNGGRWIPGQPDPDDTVESMLAVAAREFDEAWLARWLRRRVSFTD